MQFQFPAAKTSLPRTHARSFIPESIHHHGSIRRSRLLPCIQCVERCSVAAKDQEAMLAESWPSMVPCHDGWACGVGGIRSAVQSALAIYICLSRPPGALAMRATEPRAANIPSKSFAIAIGGRHCSRAGPMDGTGCRSCYRCRAGLASPARFAVD